MVTNQGVPEWWTAICKCVFWRDTVPVPTSSENLGFGFLAMRIFFLASCSVEGIKETVEIMPPIVWKGCNPSILYLLMHLLGQVPVINTWDGFNFELGFSTHHTCGLCGVSVFPAGVV